MGSCQCTRAVDVEAVKGCAKFAQAGREEYEEQMKFMRQAPPLLVFVSSQFNKCTEELLKTISDDHSHQITVKASMPRFNLKGTGILPKHVERFDVPAYGLKITDAVVQLFTVRGMDNIAQGLGCHFPKRRL